MKLTGKHERQERVFAVRNLLIFISVYQQRSLLRHRSINNAEVARTSGAFNNRGL